MAELGDRIPDLPLTLSSGKSATLGDYAGKWLVLYFYPKDSTPGCTAEGLEFNALLQNFKRAGAQVLGPITIGARAKVGSNAVVVKNVPAGTTAVGNPARVIDNEQAQKREEKAGQMGFSAYALANGQDDPLAKAIHGLLDHAVETDRRLECLLKKLEDTGVCVEDELATADKFDPKYLSKIVD